MNNNTYTPGQRVEAIKGVLSKYYEGINGDGFKDDFKKLMRNYEVRPELVKTHIQHLVTRASNKLPQKNRVDPVDVRLEIYKLGVLPRTKKNTTQRVGLSKGFTRTVSRKAAKPSSRTASRKQKSKAPMRSIAATANAIKKAKEAAKKAAANARELRALRRGAIQLVEAAKKPRRARKAPTGGPGGPVEEAVITNPVAAATDKVLDVIAATGASTAVVEQAMQKAVARRRVPGINNNNNNNNNMAAPDDPLTNALAELLEQKTSIGGPGMSFLPMPAVAPPTAPHYALRSMANNNNNNNDREEGWGGEANVDDLLALATSGLGQLGL